MLSRSDSPSGYMARESFRETVPTLLKVVATVIRTELGDKMLQNELDRYVDYAKRVRHRLVPGLW